MKLENRPMCDPKKYRAVQLIFLRPQLFSRQGQVRAVWRHYGNRRLGPYYRLFYRDGGRQHGLYLGRAGPLVEEVRAALARLQEPLRQERVARRARRQALAALRSARVHLAAELRAAGLRLQGYEVRGWRKSLLPRLPRLPRLG
jgi:hypothetical protein